MKELNLLSDYPKPHSPRLISKNLRKIEHRIVASERGKDFFDGERNYGYGGFSYDGRWKKIASRIIDKYKLSNGCKVLQVQSEKGFLLHDIKEKNATLNVYGTETSPYAIKNTIESIKNNIFLAQPFNLPFPNNYFDFVIALGTVYTFNIPYAIKSLQEIIRVSKGMSFITLACYDTEEEYFCFKDWTLLGTTILKREEWLKILKHCNYRGDYFFTSSKSLELKRV